MHFVSVIIILPHDLIHYNFACKQYCLLHCSSVSSCVCLHMSSWRRTSCSVFPGPLEMLPTSSHISPFHSQCTCPSPLHGPVLSCLCCSRSTDSTCRCSHHSVLHCNCCLNCCLSTSFLPSPDLKHPSSLCSSQLWGICLIHLCIPNAVHEPYRWTKCHDWIRKQLVCLSLCLHLYVRILTTISVSDMRHKEGISRAGMAPIQ